MRKLILKMQISLDGFIEGPEKDMSWMQFNDDEQWKDLFNMLSNVDLLLLGRVMYPDYKKFWTSALSDPNATQNEKDYARYAEQTQHIVFSNTMKDAGWNNTRIESRPVVEEVARLKQLPGGDIQIVGGAKFAATLIDSGLIDEYRLIVNPAIVASGKSFFQQVNKNRLLKLKQTKTLKSGVVIMEYTESKKD